MPKKEKRPRARSRHCLLRGLGLDLTTEDSGEGPQISFLSRFEFRAQ